MENHPYITADNENFDQEVTEFKGVAFVDFWATWCPPCRATTPFVEALAEKYKDNEKVKVVKVDADVATEITQKYQILSLPTFKTFVNGEAFGQTIGAINQEAMEKLVEEALEKLNS